MLEIKMKLNKIDISLINHLKSAKTNEGAIGAKINPIGDINNHAWISIRIINRNTNNEIFNLEYLEIHKDYDEDINGWDYDLYEISKRKYEIKTIVELE